MKDRFIRYLLNRSNSIVKCSFWCYFFFIIGYYGLYNDVIPVKLGYIFWLLLGIRLGYLIAIEAVGHINKR